MQIDLFAETAVTHESWVAGTSVGARRWPYVGQHPDSWLKPHLGIALERQDKRAWANSCLGADPTPDEIDTFIQKLDEQGVMKQSVPVLWNFESTGGGSAVLWEFGPNLKPYEQDLEDWKVARDQAYDADKGIRHARG